MFSTTIYVALGGALGASLRYLVSLTVGGVLATGLVNVLGGFIMGCAFVYLTSDKGLDAWQPVIMTGVLGGFTTFSAFSLDAIKLIQSDNLIGAGLYVLASVVLSILACGAGIWLTKGILA